MHFRLDSVSGSVRGVDPLKLSVRHVVRDEAAQLRELRLASLSTDPEAFGSTHAREVAMPADWWQGWADRSDEGTDQRTFVLVDADNRWLGLALARRDEDQPGAAVVNAMWVASQARGHGGARALCDACAAWAGGRGFDTLTLAVVVGNERALRAYTTAGFVVSGETTWDRDGRTLNELLMSRPL
jgi:GNAT superfamily N-acetyltransferase